MADNANEVKSSALSTFGDSLQRFKHHSTATKVSSASRSSPRHVTKIEKKRQIHDVSDADDTTNNKSTPSASPSPTKRARISSKYAPPSKYAHLTPLTDTLVPGLICIFVGTNPGVRTATTGHAYAHPSNSFWKLLHSSGCTDRRLQPQQDVDLPRLYSMGNTNIVSRPSKDAGELSKAEMAAGTPILEAKVAKFRPEAVCIVGKGIWEAVWRWRYGREMRKEEFRYGWQDEKERMGRVDGDEWEGARVFVATSTSGLSASTKPAEKEAIWRPFGQWVMQRRGERGIEESVGGRDVKAEPS
jgi:TDG/mug DNA glycosylase family protein